MKKILLVSIFGFILSGCGNNDECVSDIEVFVMSQKVVKDVLALPSTVDFSSITDNGVSVTGDSNAKGLELCNYSVIGYFDSQNSVGEITRTRYSLGLQYNVKTPKWIATDLMME